MKRLMFATKDRRGAGSFGAGRQIPHNIFFPFDIKQASESSEIPGDKPGL